MHNFEFFDDLDAPLFGMIMNPIWYANNMGKVDAWLKVHGSDGLGTAASFWLPDQETKTLFIMRWA